MYQVVLKKSAEKELYKLPAVVIKQIVPAIDNLTINPKPKGSKKL